MTFPISRPTRRSRFPGRPSPCPRHYSAAFDRLSCLRPLSCALAFSRPCRVKQCQSSSVAKSKIRATSSCLLYAGRPLEQLPSDVSAERTAVVPFWVRCVSHFTSWYLRRFRHRFLSSAWVAGVALRSFRLRTSVHCQRASHPGSCRDPTQAAHPSHRSSGVALLGTLALR